jgi:hypothetical protein
VSDIINTSLSSFLSHDFFISPNGRAYPDISAQGMNYQVVRRSETSSINGTSASTPVSFLFSSKGYDDPKTKTDCRGGFRPVE